MNIVKLSLLGVLGLLGVLEIAEAQPKIPPKYHAPVADVAYLPKYCYQQYVDGSLAGTAFSIPLSCGYAMNHFCPGLVDLTEASRVTNAKNERIGRINGAIDNFQYTLREMSAGCPIANDVHRAMAKAKMLSTIVK